MISGDQRGKRQDVVAMETGLKEGIVEQEREVSVGCRSPSERG